MPVFYCENCGREVPPEVSSCPYCGKEFYSVRCPVCSFTGPAEAFVKGCPSCGYQGSEDKGRNKFISNTGGPEIRKRKTKQLPGWVYSLFLVFLLGGLVFLIKIYISL